MGDPFPTDPFDLPIGATSSGGVDLALYDLGGDGPDLLMVHATGFCAGTWAPLAAHLDGFRLAAVDVRGHGRSAVPVGGMDWAGTGDDVLAAVDALGLQHPAGVGHSMGGAALLLAELARPGTFRALWLFEPIVFPAEFPADGNNPLVGAALRRRATFDSAAAAVENFSRKQPLDELDPACLEAYVRYGFAEAANGSVTLRCRPEVEAETFRMAPLAGLWERLGGVTCPVTVVRGRLDPGPAALGAGIADRLPRGRLEEHPELGHFGPLQALAPMADSIRSAVTPAA